MKKNVVPVLIYTGLLAFLCACSQPSLEPGRQAVKDVFTELPPGSIRFNGYLENDLMKNLENWVKDMAPYDGMVEVFRSGRVKFAQGEHWGKAVSSGCLYYRYTQDPELKEVLDETVADLLTTVRENGSITPSAVSDQPEPKAGDIWERKYVLLGLYRYYTMVNPDPAVLEAMMAQADVLTRQIGPPPKTRIIEMGWSSNHIESSTILEPMVLMYNLTGKESYLDFAKYVIDEGGAKGHRIIEDAVNYADPIDIGGDYPKAYEMMSLFEGLVEYYRVTGDDRWKQGFMNMYNKIRDREITIIGNGGGDLHKTRAQGEAWVNTSWEQTNPDIDRMMETCVGVTWLKFCSQINRLTGEPSAVDFMERYAYNGLIGSMNPDGTDFGYMNRMNGIKINTHGWGSMIHDIHVTCCNLNGAVGLAWLPLVAVMNSEEGPVINLYNACTATASSAKGKPVGLDIETDYPVTGHVSITVTPASPEEFSLRLRIPSWSRNTVVHVNGEAVQVMRGTYAEIRRNWSPGDRVELELDMRARLIDAPHGSNRAGDDFQALVRGPVVLSRDQHIDDDYNQPVRILAGENGFVDLVPEEPLRKDARMQFRVPTSGGDIHMVDYASVNCWEGKEAMTWLPKIMDK
jgi:DUF1680 family protein